MALLLNLQKILSNKKLMLVMVKCMIPYIDDVAMALYLLINKIPNNKILRKI